MEAQQISSKAAAVGFDWENPGQVLEKLDEELSELAEARESGTPAELEGEIGDLLFVLVNLARKLKVDPEQALRKTNAKFRRRFAFVEMAAPTLPRRPHRRDGSAVAGCQSAMIEIRRSPSAKI